MKAVKLRTGVEMPIIGYGTFQVKGKELIHRCLEAALSAGYRSIDTASVYKNEEDIGASLEELLPKFGLTRKDVFITSKLGPRDQGSGNCRAACLQSLEKLRTDYLDLYLIHWPGTQFRKAGDDDNPRLRLESWCDMEQLYKEGKVKAIGVSNFEERHLTELMAKCEVEPAVLQIEFHPHLVQKSLVQYCEKQNIQFQAYSSLGTSAQDNQLLKDETILSMAEKYNRQPAQILLRWAVQQGIGVIPKSSSPEHIESNIDIFTFDLADSDMDTISAMHKDHHYCWNPHAIT